MDIEVWAAANAAKLIIGAFVLVLILALGGWLYWEAGSGARQEATAAKAQAAIAQNDVGNGQAASNIVDNNGKTEAATAAQTRANHDVIVKAAGASVAVSDAVDAAGRRAICMRKSAANDPECASVLHPSP